MAQSLIPRSAHAFDDEPNDDCASGETAPIGFHAVGDLDTTGDVDVFRLTSLPPGTLDVELHNLSNSEDDFALELDEAASGASVATASSSPPRAPPSRPCSAWPTPGREPSFVVHDASTW